MIRTSSDGFQFYCQHNSILVSILFIDHLRQSFLFLKGVDLLLVSLVYAHRSGGGLDVNPVRTNDRHTVAVLRDCDDGIVMAPGFNVGLDEINAGIKLVLDGSAGFNDGKFVVFDELTRRTGDCGKSIDGPPGKAAPSFLSTCR